MTLDLVEVAKLAVQAAEEKKAVRPVILDIQGLSVIADYFVIASGHSEKQVQSIATGVKDGLEEAGVHVRGVEGYDQGRWVLIDAGDVVIHIFHRDERDFYDLERLWGDAKTVGVQ